ncbi:MAG: hypothetical protein CMJ31_01270 [Phycisphaerae bacterium]|nr:hypothetical protein [Phycisphaerae bacterium]
MPATSREASLFACVASPPLPRPLRHPPSPEPSEALPVSESQGTDPLPRDRSPTNPSTQSIPDDRLLLTEREAAGALAISPRKLWELRMCGEVPHVRFGRAVRYSRIDLERWIESRRTTRG